MVAAINAKKKITIKKKISRLPARTVIRKARKREFVSKELMEKAKTNPKTFNLLVKTITPYYKSIAAKFNPTADEKKDLVQRSLIKTWLVLPGYNPKSRAKPKSFLYRVAINEMIDHLRKRGKIKKEELSIEKVLLLGKMLMQQHKENIYEFKIKVLSPEEKYEIKRNYNKVIKVIKRMKPEYKQIAFYFFGIEKYPKLSYEQIAEAMNMNYDTVRWRLFRILKYTRKQLNNPTHSNLTSRK